MFFIFASPVSSRLPSPVSQQTQPRALRHAYIAAVPSSTCSVAAAAVVAASASPHPRPEKEQLFLMVDSCTLDMQRDDDTSANLAGAINGYPNATM